MRRFVHGLAASIVVMTAMIGSAAAAGCNDLSYAEQEGCWPRQLATQARQMRMLVEKRISKVTPDDLNNAAQLGAYAQTLRQIQATWEIYRDTECSSLGFVMRRHIQSAIDSCKSELNQKRLEILRVEASR